MFLSVGDIIAIKNEAGKLIDLFRRIKNAPKEFRECRSEVELFEDVLAQVEPIINQHIGRRSPLLQDRPSAPSDLPTGRKSTKLVKHRQTPLAPSRSTPSSLTQLLIRDNYSQQVGNDPIDVIFAAVRSCATLVRDIHVLLQRRSKLGKQNGTGAGEIIWHSFRWATSTKAKFDDMWKRLRSARESAVHAIEIAHFAMTAQIYRQLAPGPFAAVQSFHFDGLNSEFASLSTLVVSPSLPLLPRHSWQALESDELPVTVRDFVGRNFPIPVHLVATIEVWGDFFNLKTTLRMYFNQHPAHSYKTGRAPRHFEALKRMADGTLDTVGFRLPKADTSDASKRELDVQPGMRIDLSTIFLWGYLQRYEDKNTLEIRYFSFVCPKCDMQLFDERTNPEQIQKNIKELNHNCKHCDFPIFMEGIVQAWVNMMVRHRPAGERDTTHVVIFSQHRAVEFDEGGYDPHSNILTLEASNLDAKAEKPLFADILLPRRSARSTASKS
ncbi:hypothetical protein FISHEDRAFT_75661 [Fistulina hepatica ATCC 64428]|uniref:Uncharacterized protein n=1 Tax=Fistulina hepatica ATCC 64428 TaxID=1128425 RepID=A0A0D7A919_9AGAR|nr:hypothetical protein FISHEDRAFT_75661 [Fistulina hepatica ATCC 64428]